MLKLLKYSTTKLVLLCIVSLLLTIASNLLNPEVAIADNNIVITGKNKIVFTINSKEITFNGAKTTSEEPITVIKGTSYVQFKTIATLYGFKVGYDSTSKSSVASNKNNKITFKQGSTEATLNDRKYYTGSPYTKDGNLLIPISTWSEMTHSYISLKGNTLTLTWDTAPEAYFSVNEYNIFAGQTKVTITDNSSSLYGFDIVDEEWIGKQTIYHEPGWYAITRRVKDERGVWSNPYTVNIEVRAPNEAPIAAFTTDKNTYKLGEPVIYTNKSKDDIAINVIHWSGNEPAFFSPGKHTVTLSVLDEEGLTSTVSKDITVLDEVMYTKDQFYLNFTSIGNKFPIDTALALRIAATPYTITPEDITIVRMNSPELLLGPAIDYTDTLSGKVRFNIHKQNGAQQDLELHLMVTNENSETAFIDKNYLAAAGPSSYIKTSIRTAEKRYLSQLLENQPAEQIVLQPGQSFELFGNGQSAMHTNQSMTIFAEYTVLEELPLKFTLMVTEKGTDEIAALTTLQQSSLNANHVRGAFAHGNREITTDKVLGVNGSDKLIIGEKSYDQLLQGFDAVTGKSVTNSDNGGVFYKLKLEVAPNTAIVMNPRGGQYGGSFIVNDEIIDVIPRNGNLEGPKEAIILHRTGNKQETVTMMFLVAPGSNMPLHLLFLPLPSFTFFNKPLIY